MRSPLHRFFPFQTAALPAVFLLLCGALAFGAEDKETEKEKAKTPPRPIKLSVAKSEANAVPVPEADSGVDIDPNLPSYLRPVRLYNHDGRYLDARLVTVSGSILTVKRLSDDKQFEIPLESLDAPSLGRVEVWMERDPTAVNFSVGIEARKRQAESDTFETQGRLYKTSRWIYDVVLTNRSRNDLNDAEVEFRIIYDDHIEFVKMAYYPGKGKKQMEGEAVDLPVLGFNGRAEFSTPAVELHTYEYQPIRGEKEEFHDQLVGIWIRVSRRGNLIAEYQSHPSVMRDLAWDGPDSIDIVVRDSFREQFETERTGE